MFAFDCTRRNWSTVGRWRSWSRNWRKFGKVEGIGTFGRRKRRAERPQEARHDCHGILITITPDSQGQPDGSRHIDHAGSDVFGGPIHPWLGHRENLAGLVGDYRGPET